MAFVRVYHYFLWGLLWVPRMRKPAVVITLHGKVMFFSSKTKTSSSRVYSTVNPYYIIISSFFLKIVGSIGVRIYSPALRTNVSPTLTPWIPTDDTHNIYGVFSSTHYSEFRVVGGLPLKLLSHVRSRAFRYWPCSGISWRLQ